MLDWGDGDYGRTASVLEPAARRLAEFAEIRAGDRVLDVACGTGNAAIAAAELGAEVMGVDASPGLVTAAQRRARSAGVEATFVVGDAGALPVPDDAHDVTVSAFGVIFADDPRLALAEMLRATRPGGVVALTTWSGAGPIHEAGQLLRAAVPAQGGPPPRWEDPDWVHGLLVEAGGQDPRADRGRIVFRDTSPADWFAEQERFHPVWRWVRSTLDETRWERLRLESIAVLAAGSEEPVAFRFAGGYHLIRARAG